MASPTIEGVGIWCLSAAALHLVAALVGLGLYIVGATSAGVPLAAGVIGTGWAVLTVAAAILSRAQVVHSTRELP